MRGRMVIGLMTAVAAAPLGAQTAMPGVTMIFFDWGKMTLDPQYAAAIDAAAAAYRAAPGATVSIEGHSDRSGPAGANLAASRQRALLIRDALVARGIPASAMQVAGLGESTPLIPTADGVREPQNRRVDIRIAAPAS